MEQAEVSIHQVKVFQCVADSGKWMTNNDIAKATGVSHRTTCTHTKRLVDLGIFDQAELFPGHRFRLSEKAKARNPGYLLRIKNAQEIFALA